MNRTDLVGTVRLPRRYIKRRVQYVWRDRKLYFPSNLAAETTILGAVLLDNASFKECKVLEPQDFSLDSHRRIFQRMGELMASDHAVDIVTLAEKMRSEIADCGGVAYLASLTEGLPRCPVITEYILIVKEKRRLRTIMQACSEAVAKAQSQEHPASEIVAELGIALKGISKRKG